jgi:SHS2 domain-containing protein
VTTAILATLGALFAYQAGATQAAAMLYKNDAAIKKTEASNQWNFYQAKSNKQNLAELGFTLASGDKAEQYGKDVERYKTEKTDIQKQAEALEIEAKVWDERSDEQMHHHHRWAQATTILQVAIALSAIALLTRRSWLQYGVYGVSVLGAALGIAALLHL